MVRREINSVLKTTVRNRTWVLVWSKIHFEFGQKLIRLLKLYSLPKLSVPSVNKGITARSKAVNKGSGAFQIDDRPPASRIEAIFRPVFGRDGDWLFVRADNWYPLIREIVKKPAVQVKSGFQCWGLVPAEFWL